MINKANALLQITRPVNTLISFLSVIVAFIISFTGHIPPEKLILAGLAASLTAAAGNVINDIFDINIDRINRPARVLPAGKLTVNDAWTFYTLLNCFAVFFAAYLNFAAVLIVIISILLLYLYSAVIKKIILAGNIVIAALTGLAFVFGGVAAGSVRNSLIPAAFAFLVNFIREIVKDIEDLNGDLQNSIMTFPGKYGVDSARFLISAAGVALLLFTFIPFVYKIYNIEYFLIVLFSVDILLLVFLKNLYGSNVNWSRLSRILKLSMIFGLAAILSGK